MITAPLVSSRITDRFPTSPLFLACEASKCSSRTATPANSTTARCCSFLRATHTMISTYIDASDSGVPARVCDIHLC